MIHDLNDRLAMLADWRDQLRRLLAYALNSEFPPDYDALRLEVEQFKLACKGAEYSQTNFRKGNSQ
jgi:hypothetical protein